MRVLRRHSPLGSEPNQIVALSQQIRFGASAWRTWRGQWGIYSG